MSSGDGSSAAPPSLIAAMAPSPTPGDTPPGTSSSLDLRARPDGSMSGRGLFAPRPFDRGDIVYAERPLLCVQDLGLLALGGPRSRRSLRKMALAGAHVPPTMERPTLAVPLLSRRGATDALTAGGGGRVHRPRSAQERGSAERCSRTLPATTLVMGRLWRIHSHLKSCTSVETNSW